MTYILVDGLNMFFRARHAVRGDVSLKLGMSLHVMFNGVKKAWQDFNGTHVIFCFDGRSWRKEFYAPYKANRSVARAAMSAKEQEEDKLFFEVFEEFKQFITEKTNCTVLSHPNLEADDLIAGFIQMHPESNHVIISTDSDFHQLIAPNVKQYNGISEITTAHDGIFDKKGKLVVDKKTKVPVPVPDPQWILFEKCMRGDSSDNVFSAFPGVRKKGTKNKVGLEESFADRDTKGWAWNNMMLQRWVDHNGVEHRVLDDYNRNVTLIDLTAQPAEIREKIEVTINEIVPKEVSQVGIRLLKFCQSFDLTRITDSIASYAAPFQAKYVSRVTHDNRTIDN